MATKAELEVRVKELEEQLSLCTQVDLASRVKELEENLVSAQMAIDAQRDITNELYGKICKDKQALVDGKMHSLKIVSVKEVSDELHRHNLEDITLVYVPID